MDIQTKQILYTRNIRFSAIYLSSAYEVPKYEKFSLQTATRNAILEMLQEVIKWDKTATKALIHGRYGIAGK